MDKRHVLGQRGEEIAARYLQHQGYHVLARNYRHERAEIDLICRHKRWLVFVEVKTRSTQSFGYPEESLSPAQASRIVEAACAFARENHLNDLFRFDMIAITWKGSSWSLSHFEDAFY